MYAIQIMKAHDQLKDAFAYRINAYRANMLKSNLSLSLSLSLLVSAV